MPRGNKQVLTAYMSKEDYNSIKKMATQTRLSISEYVRRVCLGYEPKSKIDQEAILALLKVNADMSRLGGLLKLALAEKSIDRQEANILLESIKKTKQQLDEKVKAL